MLSVGANITGIRLMDPSDFHVKNVIHDWEELEKRQGRYYRVDASQIKVSHPFSREVFEIFSNNSFLNDFYRQI